MSRTIDEIYLSIGRGVSNAISSDWSEAYIFAEVFDDAANLKGEYVLNKSKGFFEVADEAFDDFEELHEITTENNSNKWNRAKFTLYPSGKFSIDFEWDQSLDDEINANS